MFNWDVVEHEYKGTPWEFTAEGKTWRLPHVSNLTLGQQTAADHGRLELVMNEVGEVFDAKGKKWKPAGKAGASMILGKHGDQIGVLKAAWLAHAGMEPGESPASSD